MNWTELLVGFGFGLIGAFVGDLVRERIKGKRLRAGVKAEISRIRIGCIGILWTIAKDHGHITQALAALTLRALDEFPWSNSELLPAERDELKAMTVSQDACALQNQKPREPGLMSFPEFSMPVFAGQTEVVGYLSRAGSRAVIDVYYSISGINRICTDLQDYSVQRPSYIDEVRRRLDETHSRAQDALEADVRNLIFRCEEALKLI